MLPFTTVNVRSTATDPISLYVATTHPSTPFVLRVVLELFMFSTVTVSSTTTHLSKVLPAGAGSAVISTFLLSAYCPLPWPLITYKSYFGTPGISLSLYVALTVTFPPNTVIFVTSLFSSSMLTALDALGTHLSNSLPFSGGFAVMVIVAFFGNCIPFGVPFSIHVIHVFGPHIGTV